MACQPFFRCSLDLDSHVVSLISSLVSGQLTGRQCKVRKPKNLSWDFDHIASGSNLGDRHDITTEKMNPNVVYSLKTACLPFILSAKASTSEIWYRGPSFHQFISGVGLQRGAWMMITMAPANMPSQPSQNRTRSAQRVRTHLKITTQILPLYILQGVYSSC